MEEEKVEEEEVVLEEVVVVVDEQENNKLNEGPCRLEVNSWKSPTRFFFPLFLSFSSSLLLFFLFFSFRKNAAGETSAVVQFRCRVKTGGGGEGEGKEGREKTKEKKNRQTRKLDQPSIFLSFELIIPDDRFKNNTRKLRDSSLPLRFLDDSEPSADVKIENRDSTDPLREFKDRRKEITDVSVEKRMGY